MEASLVYLIVFIATVMAGAIALAAYHREVGFLIVGVGIAIFGGFLPGIIWYDSQLDRAQIYATFEESLGGRLIEGRAAYQDTTAWRFEWVDEDNQYHISVVIEYPWGEDIVIEEITD